MSSPVKGEAFLWMVVGGIYMAPMQQKDSIGAKEQFGERGRGVSELTSDWRK